MLLTLTVKQKCQQQEMLQALVMPQRRPKTQLQAQKPVPRRTATAAMHKELCVQPTHRKLLNLLLSSQPLSSASTRLQHMHKGQEKAPQNKQANMLHPG
jgi:hypothetical protein